MITDTSSSPIIPSLVIDIEGKTLTNDDQALLQNPHVAGIILFGRHVESPEQVRALTDQIRTVNPNLIICVDQEGGRVARLRTGFSPLPAMGQIGKLYDSEPTKALQLAYDIGYLMACEVLAVGIDVSFAPVLDIDNGSLVIGDRAFYATPKIASILSERYIDGMKSAGMGATGKHFPGHGSVVPDSHTHDACDERSFEEIFTEDMQVFLHNLPKLAALMPAHVVFDKIDKKPAGFSSIWLQDIIRTKLGFNGVLFSDDLSMKAAHIAGDVPDRVKSALLAGCDVALICNDRAGAILAIDQAHTYPPLNQYRFGTMKASIPSWQGDLTTTCQTHFSYWESAKVSVTEFLANLPKTT